MNADGGCAWLEVTRSRNEQTGRHSYHRNFCLIGLNLFLTLRKLEGHRPRLHSPPVRPCGKALRTDKAEQHVSRRQRLWEGAASGNPPWRNPRPLGATPALRPRRRGANHSLSGGHVTRCTQFRLLAAATLSVALGGGSLWAEEPAAPKPVAVDVKDANDINDVSAQIKAMQAKLDALQVKQQEMVRQRDVQTTTADVIKDAERRSTLLDDSMGFTAGFRNNRFTIQSEDGAYTLPALGPHPVPRDDREPRGLQGRRHAGRHPERLRNAPRRLGFDGTLFTPDFTYFINWATTRANSNTYGERFHGRHDRHLQPIDRRRAGARRGLDAVPPAQHRLLGEAGSDARPARPREHRRLQVPRPRGLAPGRHLREHRYVHAGRRLSSTTLRAGSGSKPG